MRSTVKFHLTAISLISAIIVIIYSLFGPGSEPSMPAASLTSADNYVRIVSATWGRNCNVSIENELNQRAREGLKKDAEGKIIPAPELKKVVTNNALENVKALCDGKRSCNSRIDSDSIGIEPMVDCFKRLELTYRCFETDRLHSLSIGQGENLTIDCSKPADANAPAPGK